MNYDATPKQQGLHRRLTGEWLPRGCGKSKASRLIAAAIANPTPETVEISAYRITTTMDACRVDAATYVPAIQWEYERRGPGGTSRNSGYPTAEAAETAARSRFPAATYASRTGIREIHID